MAECDLVFNQPSAWRGLEGVYTNHIAEIGPIKTIVEIGVDYGFSLFHFAKDFPDATIIGIDNYDHPLYTQHNAEQWVLQFLNDFRNVLLIKSNSLEAARLLYCSIDLLHIDGDHTYEAVKSDFAAWEPKVRSGGCIMFHDTISFPNDIGRFFEELKGTKINFPLYNGLGFWFKDR
jgi:predicted O-methyltransferase YrrM